MKNIVSVSLGSSTRDKSVAANFLGQDFSIERIGVNGDMAAFTAKIAELDGKVDVFGLGGTDLYIYSGDKRYTFKDIRNMIRTAVKTPIVDGSGLKNTLERETVSFLQQKGIVDFRNSNTLMVCAVDRFGMAQALSKIGGKTVYGDMMFSLGVNLPIRSFKTLTNLANIILPVIVNLPFTWFYPTGESQDKVEPKWTEHYKWADIIAGDFLLIRRYMPDDLTGKIILTNTTTAQDKIELRNRGVKLLITTTPEFDGRSFGTNVMEAVLTALLGKPSAQIDPSEYMELLHQLNWKPRIEDLTETAQTLTAAAQ